MNKQPNERAMDGKIGIVCYYDGSCVCSHTQYVFVVNDFPVILKTV